MSSTLLRKRDFTASDISTPAATKTLDTYEDAIPEFEEEDWTYIPMPEDGKYYNIKTDQEPLDIVESQLIDPNLHLLEVMERLLEHPFLLVEYDDSYEILNLSNLNKREVKDFLYPLFSELTHQLSQQIEDYYGDSQDLFGPVREHTLGTWIKARDDDVELHIAEFLTLGGMISIIKGHDPLMDKCGFKNNDEVDKLGGIKDLRNQIMHGNRTLVNKQETLKKHLERIERAENIVQDLS